MNMKISFEIKIKTTNIFEGEDEFDFAILTNSQGDTLHIFDEIAVEWYKKSCLPHK